MKKLFTNKKMTLTQYFQVIKPKYTFLKLTPDISIRNYNSSNIAKSISYMYKNIVKRIKKEEKHFTFETQIKCSYMIEIKKNEVNFYFIVPFQYVPIIKEKIQETWPRVTVEEVEEIKPFSHDALKYQLNYKKEDALSLNVNRASNDPMNSLLNVIDIMQDKDRIGIFYNFMPISQLGWKKEYSDTMKKIKSKMPIEKEKTNFLYIFKVGLSYLIALVDSVIEVVNDFSVTTNKPKEELSLLEIAAAALNNSNTLSSSTKKKKDADVISTQLMVISDSEDETRKSNNAEAVCQSYKSIDEDNEIIYKKVNNKKSFGYTDFRIQGVEENKVSVEECQNFLQLPGRELLDRFSCIKKNDVLQTEIPSELRQGNICIGVSEYKESKQKAYLTTDKDYKNLAVVIVGPTRSGKTSLLGNVSRNSVDCGECVIVLDYIENCGLSEDIKACIPNDKVLEINLYDHTKLQGLGYNEAITESNDPFKIYESAKKQTSQIITLVNSINIENSDFTPKMERYLSAAALVAFVQKGAIRDVFKILKDHEYRKLFIDRIPENQKENLDEYIGDLKELDEWSKPTKDNPSVVTGTHTSYISGIIDRFNKLKGNTYMELMLKKGIEDNINLLDEMEKNQAIFIKMPESMFSTADERDIMTTYWLTKIWMSAQARAWKIPDRYKRKTVNVITDEIAQLKSSEQFIGNKLDQTAKFGVKFILSTMYINQLRIREKLRTANTSYMLISGADKINYTELKDELSKHGYTLEDLMNLKRFHSLNYIKYDKGYSAFITKLPKPLV